MPMSLVRDRDDFLHFSQSCGVSNHVWDSPGRANRRRSKFRRRRRRASSRYYTRRQGDFHEKERFRSTEITLELGKTLIFSTRDQAFERRATFITAHVERESDRQFTRIGDFGSFAYCGIRELVSLRFQHRVRCVLLVFEARGLYSALKYVKLTPVSLLYIRSKKNYPDTVRVMFTYSGMIT